MSLNHLSSFFRRFKTVTIPDESVRKAFSDIVREKTGIEISIEYITVRNGEILVKTNPAIKNELFIKKQEILEAVKEKTTKMMINIR